MATTRDASTSTDDHPYRRSVSNQTGEDGYWWLYDEETPVDEGTRFKGVNRRFARRILGRGSQTEARKLVPTRGASTQTSDFELSGIGDKGFFPVRINERDLRRSQSRHRNKWVEIIHRMRNQQGEAPECPTIDVREVQQMVDRHLTLYRASARRRQNGEKGDLAREATTSRTTPTPDRSTGRRQEPPASPEFPTFTRPVRVAGYVPRKVRKVRESTTPNEDFYSCRVQDLDPLLDGEYDRDFLDGLKAGHWGTLLGLESEED